MQPASIVHDNTPEPYAALAHGERLTLWACRTWAAFAGAGHCPLCPIEHEFDRIGIVDAASALHALMCVTATSATRAFEIHGPGCRHISGDEARLLHATAAAQHGELESARAQLQEWLPLAQADMVLNQLRVFAASLKSVGLDLPVRSHETILESGIVCSARGAPTSTTLH
jgi:hypothetical protein